MKIVLFGLAGLCLAAGVAWFFKRKPPPEVCVRCKTHPVEFDVPERWCGECWAWWFSHNQPDDEVLLSPEEEEAYFNEILTQEQRNGNQH